MIETVVSYNSFWLIISLVVIVAIVTIGIVIRGKSGDKKDTFIFAKSSDNAKDITIDTTSKMASMHDKVIPVKYTSVQEKELHIIQSGLRELQTNVQDLKEKVDLLLQRVDILEHK